MPRPVDPERHRARRLQIIDAGLTTFAEHGYAGATTAIICRHAGVGSGTFFHYFPTKLALLVAIIDEGTQQILRFFAGHTGSQNPRAVIFDYIAHAVDELRDPRVAGFVSAVGGLLAIPEVDAALTADDETLRRELVRWLRAAQEANEIRHDVPAERLATWVALLLDGFTGRIALGGDFVPQFEAPLLIQQVTHLLDDDE